VVKPSCRRKMAQDAVLQRSVNIHLACVSFNISEKCYRYQSKLKDKNALIAAKLVELTDENRDWGFGICFAYLRHVAQYRWNHKRIYRIYCELALNLRIKPKRTPVIRCDNGPEFISHQFTDWAKDKGIRIEYIQPGNHQQNAYIERYNRTVRYSWLSQNLFDTLEEVQDYATKWLWHYNHERPHQANQGKPPLMVA